MTNTNTLSELAATSLRAVRILETHGLDYCCGGRQQVGEACRQKGLDPAALLAEIAAAAQPGDTERDWREAPVEELAKHIVDTHHEYLKAELPAIGARLAKVHSVHGPKDPERLQELVAVFGGLREELAMHLQKEEQILFPYILQYGMAQRRGEPMPPVPFGTIAHPIQMMEFEHDGAGDALARIRELTGNFTLPEYACTTVRHLYAGLEELEKDLHLHIHLENNILFPKAIAFEKAGAVVCRS